MSPVSLYKPNTKATLVEHLERDHTHAVTVKIDAKRWTKAQLEETHRIIHLGLGQARHHPNP